MSEIKTEVVLPPVPKLVNKIQLIPELLKFKPLELEPIQGFFDFSVFVHPTTLKKLKMFECDVVRILGKCFQICSFAELPKTECIYLTETIFKNFRLKPNTPLTIQKVSQKVIQNDDIPLKSSIQRTLPEVDYISFSVLSGPKFSPSVDDKKKDVKKKKKKDSLKYDPKKIKNTLSLYIRTRKIFNYFDIFSYMGYSFRVKNMNRYSSINVGRITYRTKFAIHFPKPIMTFSDVIVKKSVNLMNMTGTSYRVSIYSDFIDFEKNEMKSLLLLKRSSVKKHMKIYSIEHIKYFEKFSLFEFHHIIELTYRTEKNVLKKLFLECKSIPQEYLKATILIHPTIILPTYIAVNILKSSKKTNSKDGNALNLTKKFYDLIRSTIICRNHSNSTFWGNVNDNINYLKDSKRVRDDIRKGTNEFLIKTKDNWLKLRKNISETLKDSKRGLKSTKEFKSLIEKVTKRIKNYILNEETESEIQRDLESFKDSLSLEDFNYIYQSNVFNDIRNLHSPSKQSPKLIPQKKKKDEEGIIGINLENSIIFGGWSIEKLRDQNLSKLNMKYVSPKVKNSHGYAGEYSGHIKDVTSLFQRSKHIGSENSWGGPDRMMKSVMDLQWTPVQSKYCKDGNAFYNALFDQHKHKGAFKYYYTRDTKGIVNSTLGIGRVKYGLDIKPNEKLFCQKFEVPSDKVHECRNVFAKNILKNKKFCKAMNIHDEYDAKKFAKKYIFHRGVTYNQCKKAAMSSFIKNITYSIKDQVIYCLFSGSISLLLRFSICIYEGKNLDEAIALSLISFISTTFGESMIQSLSRVCSELSTENAKQAIAPIIRSCTNLSVQTLGTDLSARIVNLFRNEKIYGIAAINNLSKISGELITKILTSNEFILIITIGVTFVASTLKDTSDFFTKQISKKQYAKNLSIKLSSSVSGGIGGAIGGAVGLGLTEGNILIAAVTSSVGYLIGSELGKSVSKGILQGLVEDDAKILYRLLERQLYYLSREYFLTERETEYIIEKRIKKKLTKRWFKRVYKQGKLHTREIYIHDFIEREIKWLISQRPRIFFNFVNDEIKENNEIMNKIPIIYKQRMNHNDTKKFEKKKKKKNQSDTNSKVIMKKSQRGDGSIIETMVLFDKRNDNNNQNFMNEKFIGDLEKEFALLEDSDEDEIKKENDNKFEKKVLEKKKDGNGTITSTEEWKESKDVFENLLSDLHSDTRNIIFKKEEIKGPSNDPKVIYEKKNIDHF